jgi:hypothetical protein
VHSFWRQDDRSVCGTVSRRETIDARDGVECKPCVLTVARTW